jgi:TM2 domain-containing membrane protein YozV
MTRRRDLAALVVLALLAAPAPAAADDQARVRRLADHFYDGDQLYRAIGAYEELALFATDPAIAGYARLRIAMAYQRGQQYGDAVAAYDQWLAGPDGRGALAAWVRIQRALARAEAAAETGRASIDDVVAELAPLAAIEGPHRATASYHLARLQLLDGHPDAARRTLADGKARCAARPVDDCGALARVERAAAGSRPRRRSPALAVALSALVPGAGSFYTSHPVDGIYYLALTAGGALGALDVHDGERSLGDQKTTFYVLGGLAAVTYAANLVQGYLGARRFNLVEDLRWRRRVIAATERPLPLDEHPGRLAPPP